MKINICTSPLLYSSYIEDFKDSVVIVVDVFRATTTMCVALANGARSIIPVATLEEARSYKQKGYLVGGERDVKKFDFADFGNSPSEYGRKAVEGKDIVLSTTNGTRTIEAVTNCNSLIIGAFSNLSAVADYCIFRKKDVLVLCAGWKNTVNIEDTLFGGALAYILSEAGYDVSYDPSQIALSMWKEAEYDIWKYIRRSEHFKRLEAHNLLDEARFCLEPNTTSVLPLYIQPENKIVDISKNNTHDSSLRR